MKKAYLLYAMILSVFASQAQSVWKNVQIGGAGFVTGIIPSKTDANLKYARTDVGGAYRWDSSSSRWIPLLDWTSVDQLGYQGVESLAIDPQNNNVVYMLVGTDYFNGQKTAILKSTDRGANFTETIVTSQFKAHGNGMGRSNGERLAVDPNNSNVLFCGSRRDGLFKSTNGGSTWTKVSSFPVTTTANDNGICFVIFDSASVSGGITQTIYAGVSRTGASNLYKSTDAGNTWNAVSGATVNYMPQRAVLDSNRALLITYADKEGPWNPSSGQIWKLSSAGALTNITPSGFSGPFGGIDVDPSNSQRLIASSMNTYMAQYTNAQGSIIYADRFFLSTDGGSSWRDLVGNSGINVLDNGCTWISGSSASIHWTGDIKFNPFNTNKASVISGNGIFTCDDLNASKTSWKFDAIGLEESVPLGLISIPGGPLMSVIGDYDGFKHTDVSVYAPQYKPAMGTTSGLAYASGNTNKIVRLGEYMYYSNNQGTDWTKTTANLAGSRGTVALSYDGATILHVPESSSAMYRSTNNGASWTTVTGINFNTIPVSDAVTNNKFYAYNGSNGDLKASTDGGASFNTVSNVGAWGSSLIRTVPGYAGHLWIAKNSGGLIRSVDGGTSFTTPSTAVSNASAVGIGKAKAGASYPTIYIWGTVSGVTGVFRSVDQGSNWTRVNDDAHEYGGTGNGNFVMGDMNIYGRVYMSTVGRGLVYGDDLAETASYYTISNRSTGMLIDGMSRTTNGSNAGQWNYSGSSAQQWSLEYNGSEVMIKNRATGLYIDGMSRTANPSIAGQWNYSGSEAQKWIQEDAGSGYLKFKNKATGLYLDGLGNATNGADLSQWSLSSSNNQQWSLTAVSSATLRLSANAENLQDQKITVICSPNPFTSSFKIEINDYKEPINVRIFDINGKNVESAQVKDQSQLSMGNTLQSGFYIVKVEGTGGNLLQSFKMIKKAR
ncbi:Por secretion system C-terminal sorting domain-containing protein [Flavobacterium anhuiense]|uniref:Por secretion system C-terminal sorting domain-containing protein n=1 Tax=Flavobacterium anhuiense TaxID=459526 RepID=A0ABY0M1I7_9FLAO|nr:RICIN domain-containing protein [Flavobacterium anhuiense]SCY90888.1 Por secretion system C-terminal sorting domain-containing protein [Flavobacterium anhuiense]